MKKYKVELNLELLSSCHWKCEGCFVSRNTKTFDLKALPGIIDELIHKERKDIELSHLEIGPTDFLESKDFNEILKNENVIELITSFDEIFLTTTFDNLSMFDEYIKLIPNSKIRIFVNFNISKNITEFINKQKTIEDEILVNYPHINLYYTPMGVLKMTEQSIKSVLKKIKDSDLAGIVSFNYACGRLRAPKRELLLEELSKISTLNNALKSLGMDSDRGELEEEQIKCGFLLNGSGLYRMPYVGQFFINNISGLRISNLKEIFSKKGEIIQGVKSINKSECLVCTNLSRCKQHHVLSLMDELEVDYCINKIV